METRHCVTVEHTARPSHCCRRSKVSRQSESSDGIRQSTSSSQYQLSSQPSRSSQFPGSFSRPRQSCRQFFHVYDTVREGQRFHGCQSGLQKTGPHDCCLLVRNALQESVPVQEKWEETLLEELCKEKLCHTSIIGCMCLHSLGGFQSLENLVRTCFVQKRVVCSCKVSCKLFKNFHSPTSSSARLRFVAKKQCPSPRPTSETFSC